MYWNMTAKEKLQRVDNDAAIFYVDGISYKSVKSLFAGPVFLTCATEHDYCEYEDAGDFVQQQSTIQEALLSCKPACVAALMNKLKL